MFKQICALTIVFLVAGCAAVPESIQIDETMPLVSYQQAASDPDGTKSKNVRWGALLRLLKTSKNQP